MKLLAQRGETQFLVDVNDKFYTIRTSTEEVYQITSPDIVYRAGYWENPDPSPEQLGIISRLTAELLNSQDQCLDHKAMVLIKSGIRDS